MFKIFVGVALFAACIYASPLVNNEDESSLENKLAQWIERQEVSMDLPFGASATLNARNLESDEFEMKLQLSSESQARKSKLKKIFAPILILVILKAITLIPLALGVLGLKTWNAIQLSFVTFVISIALAVFELCKKVAADHVHPVVSHTAQWAPGRSFDDEGAQNLAYSAYNS